MFSALAATVWLLSTISATSAYYNNNYSPYYCNRADCCWALKVNHWNLHNICSGCEGQEVCNNNNNSRRTPRPTEKPTKMPVVNNNGYGDGSDSVGVSQNFCCQTTGNCPRDTPVKTHRQWLDRANRIKLTYCCEYSVSSWKGDSWEKVNNHGRSLQTLLPLCINTVEPTSSPTSIPSLQPSSTPTATPSTTPSTEPSASPSELPSTSPSSEPSSVPSFVPSSTPSDTPSLSPSSDPSESPSSIPSSNPSESPSSIPSSSPSDIPSLSTAPSAMPSDLPSLSSQPSSNPSESPSSIPSSSPSDIPSFSTAPSAMPSDAPSLSSQPSSNPSESPSSIPSSSPSDIPSLSTAPSAMPSGAPSLSSQPSSNPSESPSSIPSSSPSDIPSCAPSLAPSLSPLPSLSAQPSIFITLVGVYSQQGLNGPLGTGNCNTETDNILSIILHFKATYTEFASFQTSTSIQSFGDPDLESKLARMDVFVMPDRRAVVNQLTGWGAGPQNIIRNYVASGGALLVTGHTWGGVPFLNEIFGWDLGTLNYCAGLGTSKNVENTAGTVFSDGPDSLGCPQATVFFRCNSVNCTIMYGVEATASVVVIEHGDGRVILLGHDFRDTGYEVDGFHTDCPERGNAWVSVLRSSLLLAAGQID